MADRASTRKKQKREKKRQKDKRRAEEARRKRRSSLVKSPQKLVGLPLADCFISENWHEHGPSIVAAISRTHPNGRLAAALFTIDLAEKGVIGAELIRDKGDQTMTVEQLTAEIIPRGRGARARQAPASPTRLRPRVKTA